MKILNNTIELSHNEVSEINGGLLLELAIAYYLYTHWDDVKAGYRASTTF
jgi:hypothetical protein